MGRRPRSGTRFAQPELARTLRAIAARGKKAFYEGEVAADIVGTLRAAGGLHTEEDFARGADVAEFVDPISIDWRGMQVVQCPPNGVGMHVLQILGILGNLDTPEQGPWSAERFHRHIEAARLVYRDRDAFLADPSQVDVPVERLLSGRLPEAAGGHHPRRCGDGRTAAGAARATWRSTRTRSTCASWIATAMPVPSSTRCSRASAPASWRRSPA